MLGRKSKAAVFTLTSAMVVLIVGNVSSIMLVMAVSSYGSNIHLFLCQITLQFKDGSVYGHVNIFRETTDQSPNFAK